MAATTQAPAGGITSIVNGQRYEGGQFVPNTGLFCGKSGAKRLAKWDKAAAVYKTRDLGGSKMFEVLEYIGGGVSQVVGYALANSHKEAELAFTTTKKLNARQL